MYKVDLYVEERNNSQNFTIDNQDWEVCPFRIMEETQYVIDDHPSKDRLLRTL